MGSFKKNCEKLGLTTEADELDWIIKQSDCTILFYDAMQVIGPSGIDYQRFDQKMQNSLEQRMTSYFTLLTNNIKDPQPAAITDTNLLPTTCRWLACYI